MFHTKHCIYHPPYEEIWGYNCLPAPSWPMINQLTSENRRGGTTQPEMLTCQLHSLASQVQECVTMRLQELVYPQPYNEFICREQLSAHEVSPQHTYQMLLKPLIHVCVKAQKWSMVEGNIWFIPYLAKHRLTFNSGGLILKTIPGKYGNNLVSLYQH